MPSDLIKIKDILIQGESGQAGMCAEYGNFVLLIKIDPKAISEEDMQKYFTKNVAFLLHEDHLYYLDSQKTPPIVQIQPENDRKIALLKAFEKVPELAVIGNINFEIFKYAQELMGQKTLTLDTALTKKNMDINENIYIHDNGGTDVQRVEQVAKFIENIIQATVAQHVEGEITRAITDEFTFYPSETPYTLEEYKEIIAKIAVIMKRLPPDIHFVLATFPVLWPDGYVHNCGLHAQSPKSSAEAPLLHHFSKKEWSDIDYIYVNRENMALELSNESDASSYHPDEVLAGTAISIKDVNQYRSALKIQNAHGQEFITTIGICLDHEFGVEREHVHGLMDQLQRAQRLIPLHCSHVITSNSIVPLPEHVLSTLTHADAYDDVRRPSSSPERACFSRQEIHSPFCQKEIGMESYPSRPIATFSGDLMTHIMGQYSEEDLSKKINQQDEEGNTYLHRVFEETTQYDIEALGQRLFSLVIAGGDVDIVNKAGRSARSMTSFDTTGHLNAVLVYAKERKKTIDQQNSSEAITGRNSLTNDLINFKMNNENGPDFENLMRDIYSYISVGINPFKKDLKGDSALEIIATCPSPFDVHLYKAVMDALKKYQSIFFENIVLHMCDLDDMELSDLDLWEASKPNFTPIQLDTTNLVQGIKHKLNTIINPSAHGASDEHVNKKPHK